MFCFMRIILHKHVTERKYTTVFPWGQVSSLLQALCMLAQTGFLSLERLVRSLSVLSRIKLFIGDTPPPPDFILNPSPAGITVQQGSPGTSTITLTPLYGFTGTATLSTPNLPTGITTSFTYATVSSSQHPRSGQILNDSGVGTSCLGPVEDRFI